MASKVKKSGIDIPALWNTNRINQQIAECKKIFGPGSKSLTLLADTAFQCLLHASKHGDVTLCKRLYIDLGGSLDGKAAAAAVRIEALKTWFAKHGPITAVRGEWKIKNDVDWREPENWTLEAAVQRPFWEDMGAERVQEVTLETLMNMIKGLSKRIDKAVEENRFKGDPKAAKDWADNIVDFSAKAAQKMTPAQRGDKDANLEIIKNAVEKAPKADHRLLKGSAKAA